jgi:repressor LexA
MNSTNAVRSVLGALERKGALRRRPYLSRGIELSRPPARSSQVLRVPIVGRIAAGQPLLAEENREGELYVDRDLFKAADGFALRVKGDSMIEAGIRNGDLVLVRPDLPLVKGTIVAAVIGDEATVKYYHPEGDHIRLTPANPAFEPIIVSKRSPDQIGRAHV